MSYNNINWMGNKPTEDSKRYQNQTPQSTPQMPLQPTPQASPQGTPGEQVIPPDVVVVPPSIQGPPPVMDIDYIPGYLRSIIGKRVRAEFIIGSSQYTDRTGILIEVGVNYFVLNDVNSRTNIMCDLYSVKFVTVLV